MTSEDKRPADVTPSADLGPTMRRQADEMARVKAASWPENIDPLSPEETQRTLHELRVHQIELEMQNEELRLVQIGRAHV